MFSRLNVTLIDKLTKHFENSEHLRFVWG